MLLLNPFYKAETTYRENPSLLVFLDNSESTTIQKGSYQGIQSYNNVLNTIDFSDSSNVNYFIYSVDGKVVPTREDSLTFKGAQTNLSNIIDVMLNRQPDIAGSILISDGIFNQGRNPVFAAENVNKPIFTVALGDTSQQKDLLIKNILTNSTGYLDSHHPLEVTVLNNGFRDQTFHVQVVEDGEIIATQPVTPGDAISSHTLNFELELNEEGLQHYEVRIPAFENEWTTENNMRPFAVDVMDQKQRILSIAFEIHPDIRLIRSELLKEQNTKLFKRSWLGGSRFIEGPLRFSADSLDLLIIHGYPSSGLSDHIKQQLNPLLKKLPLLVFNTPQSNFSALTNHFDLALPVTYSSNSTVEEVGVTAPSDQDEHPIVELPDTDFSRMPPLFAPISGVSSTPGSTILFKGSYQGKNTGQALLGVQQMGNLRRSSVTAYGWYRIALSESPADRKFAKSLIANVVGWTATKPDNRKLKIKPSKKIFTGGESITLNGFLTNERGENESGAVIEVTLQGNQIDTRYYSMDNLGRGQYQLTINSMPEGLYKFEATATKGSRTIGSRQGKFSVSSSNIEYVNTVRNDRLMKQLAINTGGSYFSFDNLSDFRDVLVEKGMLDKEQKTTESLLYPYRHSFWFILVVMFLSAEWLIRKYLALP